MCVWWWCWVLGVYGRIYSVYGWNYCLLLGWYWFRGIKWMSIVFVMLVGKLVECVGMDFVDL